MENVAVGDSTRQVSWACEAAIDNVNSTTALQLWLTVLQSGPPELVGFFKFGSRLVAFARLGQCQGQVVVSFGVARLQAQRLLEAACAASRSRACNRTRPRLFCASANLGLRRRASR